jgi:isoquinoline 1-oxidoreductase beta subunit
MTGLAPDRITLHQPRYLGGFFGRHFLYATANVFPEAIALARSVPGRAVKVLWSREEEFKRDAYRPLSVAKLRAGLDAAGRPVALHATAAGEGPMGRHQPFFLRDPKLDDTVVEGLTGKPYGIPDRRVDYVAVPHPANIGFWRSVGHSMNAFFYESFLDELAVAAGQDPFAYRMALLAQSPRHQALLRGAAELGGGWRRGPFTAADGTRRARGVALASPFGSEVATIAEVSVKEGEVVVHDLFIAIDPGRIVNPAMVEAQVRSAATIGLSSALLEEVRFEDGAVTTLNLDSYPILPRERMPQVHVRIIESGAPMGGVGEPGTPGVPPAIANAVAALTGQRVRSLPLSRTRLGQA